MDKEKVSLICFGDYLLEDSFVYSSSFKDFKNLFKNRDAITFNLETTVSDKNGEKLDKAFNFKTPSKNLFNFNENVNKDVICNIANNHIMDFGEQCFYDTINNLTEAKISFTGVSTSLKIQEGISFEKINNVDIAFIGGYSNCNIATSNNAKLTNIDENLYKKVEYAKRKAKYVIVHLHWGEELSLCHSPKQVDIAHKLVDSGANLILGHHPHVIQGIEKYNGAVIAYSLGNFQMMTYDYDYNSKFGIMLDVEFKDSKIDFKVIPLYIFDRDPIIISDHNSVEYNHYLKIKSKNEYFIENNNWFVYLLHACKPFMIDSNKAWKLRKEKGEKKLLLKKVKWFFSKRTIVMSIFWVISFLKKN